MTVPLVLVACLSLAWTPYDPEIISSARLTGPTWQHWLGTDWAGRDVASRIMVGAQNSIVVGLVAVAIGLSVGVSLGALAAARRDWLDDLVMRSTDVIFAFPAIISALLITTILGTGKVNAIIAIGIFNIPVFARVLTLRLAEACSTSGTWIDWPHSRQRHFFPAYRSGNRYVIVQSHVTAMLILPCLLRGRPLPGWAPGALRMLRLYKPLRLAPSKRNPAYYTSGTPPTRHGKRAPSGRHPLVSGTPDRP